MTQLDERGFRSSYPPAQPAAAQPRLSREGSTGKVGSIELAKVAPGLARSPPLGAVTAGEAGEEALASAQTAIRDALA